MLSQKLAVLRKYCQWGFAMQTEEHGQLALIPRERNCLGYKLAGKLVMTGNAASNKVPE